MDSGVRGGRGRVPPDIFQLEIFADLLGKEGQGRLKWKMERKEGKFEREKVENRNGRRKIMKMSRGPFFGEEGACHFSKPLEFIWVYQNGEFLPGKCIFHAGKKFGKLTLPPLENISLMPLPMEIR